MATYIVAYDLLKTGQNYDGLITALKAYPTHWHMQQSVWLIESAQSASDIRDIFLNFLDANDRLFVCRLDAEAAWAGYLSNVSEWLKARLRE